MKRDVPLWQFAGFAFTSLIGTLLHYLYEWTDSNVIAALFSGVNESTWEHMKLLFFPLFAFALIQSRFFKDYSNFWCIKLIGTLSGLVFIPVLFYTYNGAFGKSPDWLNISMFFIAGALTFWLETLLFKNERLQCKTPFLAFFVICLICILFMVFTFAPPEIPLFKDPLR